MSDNTLHDDVQTLKEKVALLDGWRLGESDRYDRLERDMAGIKDELRLFRSDIDKRFAQVDNRFAQMDERLHHLDSKIDAQWQQLGARIDAQGQQLGARIDAQGQQLGARIDAQEKRLNQLVWLMLVTAVGVATNLAVQLLQ